MNLRKLVDRITSYEKTFSKKLDFDSGKQLRKLLKKVQTDAEVVAKAITKNEEHKCQVEESLDTYKERYKLLVKDEQSLANQIQQGAGFDEQRRLHKVQFQLRSLQREKRDYEATLETIQHWLLSLDEAEALLGMMADSLQRNLDRLGVVVETEIIREGIEGTSDYGSYLHNCPACRVRWERLHSPTCPGCGCDVVYFRGKSIAAAYRGKKPRWEKVREYIREVHDKHHPTQESKSKLLQVVDRLQKENADFKLRLRQRLQNS